VDGRRRDPDVRIKREGERRASPIRRDGAPRKSGPPARLCIADIAEGVGVAVRAGAGIVPCPHGTQCMFSLSWRSPPHAEIRRVVEGGSSFF
jgi:hypothetical protein